MKKVICLFFVPVISIAFFTGCNNIPTHESSYQITYVNLEGSIANNPDEYIYNETLVLNDSSDHGNEFIAWHLNNIEGKTLTEIVAGTTGNLVLYAEWGGLNQYNINYDFKGGSGSTTTTTYTIEETVIINNDPTIMAPGYQNFLGWYDEDDNNVIGWEAGEKIGDVNLFAKYKDPYTYNITFDPGEGIPTTCVYLDYCNGDQPQRMEVTSTNFNPYAKFPAIIREGYLFAGWYHDSSYTDMVEDGDKISYGDTLYAKWDENEHHVIITKEDTFCYYANIHPYQIDYPVSGLGLGSVPYGIDKVIFDLNVTHNKFFDPKSLYYQNNDEVFYTWDQTTDTKTITKDVNYGDYIRVEFDANGCLAADYYLENYPYCKVGTRLVYDSITLSVNDSPIVLPVTYGSVFENPAPDPTCSGKTFIGWTYNGEIVDLTKPWQIAEDATLVAKYE